jgi:hypothetical protein
MMITFRNRSTDELETMVYRYETDYFLYLGENNHTVQEFRLLIDRRDLRGLISNWRRFKKSFISLERAAGHTGRPLIIEYYLWYELVLKELSKRTVK